MSDSNEEDRTDFPADITPDRPPMPSQFPKRGYKWTFVPAHQRGNAITKPLWRQTMISHKPRQQKPRDYAAERARTAQSKRPRFTGQVHARYLRDRLNMPITYFTTLRHAQPHAAEIDQLLHECFFILKEVQVFVGRFTSEKDMGDE